jgi:hypothetical protein
MCEVGRPSARVVLQKRKESDGRHTMEFRFDLLIPQAHAREMAGTSGSIARGA